MEIDGLRAKIEFLLKEGGLIQAQRGLENLSKAGFNSQRELAALGSTVKMVGGVAAGVFGGLSIASWAWKQVTAVAELNRVFDTLTRQFQQSGLAAAQVMVVRKALEDLERTAGTPLEESAAAFRKFYAVLNDVPAALYAVQLAADLNEAGLGDMGSTTQKLVGLINGQAKGAVKEFGALLDESATSGENAEQIMKLLIERYGDYRKQTNDVLDGVDELSASWSSFTRILGDTGGRIAIPILKAINFLLNGIVAIVETIPVLALNAGQRVIGVLEGLAGGIRAVTVEGKGFFEGYAKAQAKWQPYIAASAKGLGDIWKEKFGADAGAEAAKLQAKAATDGQALMLEVLRKRADEQRKSEREKEIKSAQETARRVAEARVSASIQAARAEADLLAENSQARVDAELRILDMERDQELSAANMSADRKLAIEREYRAKRQKITTDYFAWEFEQFLDLLKRQADAAEEAARLSYEARKEQAELQLQEVRDGLDRMGDVTQFWTQRQHDDYLQALNDRRDAEIAIEEESWNREQEMYAGQFELLQQKKAIHEAKMRQITQRSDQAIADFEKAWAAGRIELAQWVVGQMQVINAAFFGNNKSLAVALAIVNTLLAITKALSEIPYPFSIIAAAAVAAQGYMTVRQIRSTKMESGKGFDDYRHDQMAMRAGETGGFRWAQDAVTKWTAGMNKGWDRGLQTVSAIPAPSLTTVNNEGDQYHFHGAVNDERSIRRWLRRARRVSRRDDRSRYLGGG